MPDRPRALNRPPRIAVIGAGLMGRWHTYTIRRMGGRIAAIVDADTSKARALARGAVVAASADELWDTGAVGGGIDVVHICTPGGTHMQIAGDAIRAAAHVIVEKPLADTAADTRTLLEQAADCNVFLCPVHQFPFQRGAERAAEAMLSLGAVHDVSFAICSAGGTGMDAAALDRVVDDILPHPFSVLRRLWPETPLDAAGWWTFRNVPGDLQISGPFGAAQLSIAVSMHARPTCFEMTVRGENGTLLVDFFHGYLMREPGDVSRLRKIQRPLHRAGAHFLAASTNLLHRAATREPAYPGLINLVRRFHDAVAGRGEVPIAPADILAVAEARDTVVRQAR